ncbi:hypothetical protein HY496_02950 [Candidatus Woesearchaeota archaeon]|nr:hypothetical protein [Candidatus Woesearchaeota archaeon]
MVEEHDEKCLDCGEIHEEATDSETAHNLAAHFTEEHFDHFWEMMKNDLKQLSKKELAEEVFFQAIAGFIAASWEMKEKEESKVRDEFLD